jgi:hypothetical protein
MKKNLLLTLTLLVLAGVLFQCFNVALTEKDSPEQIKSGVESLCERLSEIKKMPFKGEKIDDELYNEIVDRGKAIAPCLIDKITDMTRMKDPRSAPSYPDFRVGDLAFFLLVRITGTPFEQMLPDSVKARMKQEGVYAYFEYVEFPDNRRALQENWQAWLKNQTR